MSTAERERLIAQASSWAGFCVDHDTEMPDLAKLSAFLLDVKHQMALDRITAVLTATPKEVTP